MAGARELELTGRPDTWVHQLGRLLAAEICRMRGEFIPASAWLDAVPDSPAFRALRAWVECGLTRPNEDQGRRTVFLAGYTAYEKLRAGDAQPGTERLLLRLTELAVRLDEGRRARYLLAQAERHWARTRRPLAEEAALLARALVFSDARSARAGAQIARRRKDRPALLTACLIAGAVTEDPQPWLQEAYQLAAGFGSAYCRSQISAVLRERGLPVPRTRRPRPDFAPTELRIIEMVSKGWTNRQIASSMMLSEKSVERYLTGLFSRTGCRSRLELAAASLEGRLAATSAVSPDVPIPAAARPFRLGQRSAVGVHGAAEGKPLS